MMKWIAGLLLLANLALFGWMHWGAALTEPADKQTAQAALNADRVKLLEWQPASAPAESMAQVPQGLTLTLSPVSSPLVAVHSVAAESAPAAASSNTAASKNTSCAEWGEFSGNDLERAGRALAALKLGERLTQRSVEHSHAYWVFIPPLKNRADVDKKIAQLKARGVMDYFVVQEEGKWQYAISLGVFRTEEAAQKFLGSIKAKDVRSAKVGERSSKLKFVVFSLKDIDSGILAKLDVLQKEFSDSELKVSACGN